MEIPFLQIRKLLNEGSNKPPPTQSPRGTEVKSTYSDAALRARIGKKANVYTNYVGQNPPTITLQATELVEVGKDYVIFRHYDETGKITEPFFYTVNVARLVFLPNENGNF